MKRWLSFALVLVMLCSALPAMAATRPSLGKRAMQKNMENTVDETVRTQLRALLDIVLGGDEEAVKAAWAEEDDWKQLDNLMNMIGSNGEVLEIALRDVTELSDGWYDAKFEVKHTIGMVNYLVSMSPDGKLAGFRMQSQRLGLDKAPQSELRKDINYQAIAEEVIRLGAAGEYDRILENAVPELFVGVTGETIGEYVDFFGEAEWFSPYTLIEQHGYVQYTFEVSHADQPALWLITLDGEGRTAGFYLKQKVAYRLSDAAEVYRQEIETADGYLDLFLAKDLDAFFDNMSREPDREEARQAFDTMFSATGEMKNVEFYDVYEENGCTKVEYVVDFDKMDMLLRIFLDADGKIDNFYSTEVTWLQ